MPPYVLADSVVAIHPGWPPHSGAAKAGHVGGPVSQHRGGDGRHADLLSDRLVRFPIGWPEAPRGRKEEPAQGHWWLQPENSNCETDEERPPLRPRGVWAMYQGRASHPRLGTNIPIQIELFTDRHRVSGTWFMLRKGVDVVAERTDKWPLIVRAVGGGTSATLWGKEVAPNRIAGEFHFGADGGGSFELLQCPQVSLSKWGSSSHCGSSSGDSLVAPAMQEPIGYYDRPLPEHGTKLPVQSSVTKVAAKEVDSQLIFTSEAHLAEVLVEVLKVHPNGLDLAQLKPTIHRSSGLWVSEALLGYKKLRNLIRSPTMTKACWFQRVGSCNRVFGYTTAAGQAAAACGQDVPGLGDQQPSEQAWSSSVVGSSGGSRADVGDFMSPVSL